MGYNQTNNPFSRKTSPLNEGGYCAKSAGKGGCVTQKDGSWKVISNKTGKLWDANYSSEADAEAALRAYHAGGPSRMSAELADMPIVDIEKGDAKGDPEGDPTDENDMYHNSNVYDESFDKRTGPRPNMADLPLGSDQRKLEYTRRGWAWDDSLEKPESNFMEKAPVSGELHQEKMQHKGMSRHSHHMVNSWEEEDVKRGKKLKKEGHYSHAEALFDDAHGSYNWDGHNSTGAEHHGPSRKSKKERRSNRADKLREKAITRSEETGAERGDEYDYEDPKVMKWLNRANKIDPRTGIQTSVGSGPIHPEMLQEKIQHYGKTFSGMAGSMGAEAMQEMIQNKGGKK